MHDHVLRQIPFIIFSVLSLNKCACVALQPRREDCNSVRPEDWNPRIPVGISPVSKLHTFTSPTPALPVKQAHSRLSPHAVQWRFSVSMFMKLKMLCEVMFLCKELSGSLEQ